MIGHIRFHGHGGEGVKLASRIVSRAAFLAGRTPATDLVGRNVVATRRTFDAAPPVALPARRDTAAAAGPRRSFVLPRLPAGNAAR